MPVQNDSGKKETTQKIHIQRLWLLLCEFTSWLWPRSPLSKCSVCYFYWWHKWVVLFMRPACRIINVGPWHALWNGHHDNRSPHMSILAGRQAVDTISSSIKNVIHVGKNPEKIVKTQIQLIYKRQPCWDSRPPPKHTLCRPQFRSLIKALSTWSKTKDHQAQGARTTKARCLRSFPMKVSEKLCHFSLLYITIYTIYVYIYIYSMGTCSWLAAVIGFGCCYLKLRVVART